MGKGTGPAPTETEVIPVSYVSVGFSCDGMRPEAMRQDPTRKGSVVNVNPTNTRPQSDTPEIRKYKKRFNSEILCAALWGRCLGPSSPSVLIVKGGPGIGRTAALGCLGGLGSVVRG